MRFIFVFSMGLILSAGCATSDSLELESVLDLKSKRKQSREIKGHAVGVMKEAVKEELESPQLPEDTLQDPETSPPELKELRLAPEFERLQGEARQTYSEKFKGATEIYKAVDSSLILAANKIQTDADVVNAYDAARMRLELEGSGKRLQQIYKERHQASVSYKVQQQEDVWLLTFTSKFVKDEVWKVERAYVFVYKPDYRLNLVVAGNEEDFDRISKAFKQKISAFQESLAALVETSDEASPK